MPPLRRLPYRHRRAQLGLTGPPHEEAAARELWPNRRRSGASVCVARRRGSSSVLLAQEAHIRIPVAIRASSVLLAQAAQKGRELLGGL